MLLSRLAGGAKRRAARGDRRPARTPPPVRLELERLEDRTVPTAARAAPGFTVNTLPPTDDGSTGAVNVGFTLNFLGTQTSQVFVNNNGNVSLGKPLSQFAPTALDGDNGGTPVLAPFFADVDTSGAAAGTVRYGTDVLFGHAAFSVDWDHVGYFNGHADKLDSFQLILVDRSDTGAGNFDVEFDYGQIQWESGDASGGRGGLGGESARVGYSNGTGRPGTFFELPGSGVNGAFLDGGPDALVGQTLLSSTPGRLHFLVRGGEVLAPQQLLAANLDVTAGTRAFAPFRWVADPQAGLLRGDVTLLDVAAPAAPGNDLNAALDLPTGNPAALGGTAFPGPITVVFPSLPAGAQVANATGYTGSGKPYITVAATDLPREVPVLRVQVLLKNTGLDTPGGYFASLPMQIFAGPFDPAQA